MTRIESKLYILQNLIDKLDKELFSIPTSIERIEVLKGDLHAWIDEIQSEFESFEQLSEDEQKRVIEHTKTVYGVSKMHPFLNNKDTKLNLEFGKLIETLHYYSNYHTKQPRNRKPSTERLAFDKWVIENKIDVKSGAYKVYLKALDLEFEISYTSVKKYLK